jgi:hypothetical protein
MSDDAIALESNALLVGGPTHMWKIHRHVSENISVLKLNYGAGYEHYIRTDRKSVVDGREYSVFSWTSSTKVAE